jgi:O-acetyl-ADP-ribose deacetylase (regulator of RNase III)
VIHTVGPVYSKTQDRSALLASCYRESLRVAAGLGARTVAFPAVSAGIYGWPADDAARIAVSTVHAAGSGQATVRPAGSGQGTLQEVRFVLFSRDVYEEFERALAAVMQ